MKAKSVAKFHHKGQEIDLHNDGVFEADGSRFSTLDEAKKSVDEKLKLSAKQAKVKLKLAIVTEIGTKHVVTGFNASSGSLTFSPAMPKVPSRYGNDAPFDGEMYADTGDVFALIEERIGLEKKVAEIKEKIAKHSFRVSTYRIRGSTADDVTRSQKDIEKAHADAVNGKDRLA